MNARSRLIVITSSLALVVIGCGVHQRPTRRDLPHDLSEAQRHAGYPLYWAGPTFHGLPVTKILRGAGATTFIYGTCTPEPAGDEASCRPPLEIEVASICDRNALLLDVRPVSRFTARGASVLTYGDRRLELAAGASNVVVWANRTLAHRALTALRPLNRPRRAALPGARYPRYYLAQLRRVHDTYTRSGGVDAVRDRVGISRSAARFELGLARAVGAARLRRGGGASSLEQVKRDRLAATLADEQGDQSAAPALGMPTARLRTSAERGRERRRGCPVEPVPD